MKSITIIAFLLKIKRESRFRDAKELNYRSSLRAKVVNILITLKYKKVDV
jgi:hypothetical protein